jgi:sulfite reductase alpha subunit
MTTALSPGPERGATILVGAKAPIVTGALMSWVIVPFIKLEPPYEEFYDLVGKIWEWWDEHGKNRERIGELIERMGFPTFLKGVGLTPHPAMVKEPRRDPFFFWDESDIIR